ncbi:ABC transporter permease [Aquicella lusitana]|uniref:Putative ABC transport system permease protein n=1 Tax=Aquicella lusitana TaxID=254246 RepID=A0A370GLH6_9COXI|nr:FtsX-like permease family protein [Aquicella lusitana]RDI44521.1 putative ABC transport system permease protein [Aquicella lusitana]VVC72537.1 hypothetical protein AQULUS_02490 [Aquicella lusitana]
MLKTFLLAAKTLWRELRRGQWLIIFFALWLAVTAITSLHFYTDRLKKGFYQQSAKILGGDLVVSSPSQIPEVWLQKARELELRTAQVWVYPSMVSAAGHLQLVNVQAVSESYPVLEPAPLQLPRQTAWVEPRLLGLLSIQVNDKVMLGAMRFNVRALLPGDMEMVNTGWVIAPRIMIRLDDVPATRTVLAGSRVDYRLLLAGKQEQIQAFSRWIKPQLKPGQRLMDINSQRFVLQNTMQRAENYLQLVLLFCLLISGVAIALSTRQYLERHYKQVALWRCLGAHENQIILVFVWQLTMLALAAGVTGIAAGYLLQEAIAALFKDFVRFPLPAAGSSPVLMGFVTSLLLLFCYAYPIVSVLPRTSPLYLWRHEITARRRQQHIYMVIAIGFLLLFVYWMMDFSLLALFFLDVLLLSVGFLYVISVLILGLLRRVRRFTEGVVRRGISQMVQHPESVSIQLSAFTLILMSLLVLGMVRNNIIANWQQTLPANTPNYFAFNIAPADIETVQEFFSKRQISIEGIYSMVRGRLIELNGQPIMTAIPENVRHHNALHRELNLSSMLHYPSDNKVIEGKTWSAADRGKALISVEKNLADDLQLKLGDELTFQIGDQRVSARISNFRSLDWGSFHPNFYVIFTPGMLEPFPATYITSFHLQPKQAGMLNQLIRDFPNMTIIDVANALNQLQDLIYKIASAFLYLFAFAVGAAILIFITTLLSSMDERRQTYRLLRILGASQAYIYGSLFVEFFLLAILSVGLAFTFAQIISRLLMRIFFS